MNSEKYESRARSKRDPLSSNGKGLKRDRRSNYIGEDQGHEEKRRGARRNRKKYEKDKRGKK